MRGAFMSVKVVEGERLGVLSDTHGSLPAWRSALVLFEAPAAVFHAGDVIYHGPRNMIPGGYTPADLADEIKDYKGELYISRGNCDASVDEMVTGRVMEPYISALWNGRKILMMHGDNFPLTRQMAFDCGADLVITGHTHIASVVREGKTLFINPGSTTIPKGKDPASVAVVDGLGIRILTLEGVVLHREEW